MIRRLIARLLPGKGKRRSARRASTARKDHPVRQRQLSRGALQVTRRLQEAGFKAFVVGGAVRDLLLGIEPKDFDIATDAHPEQVKPLFRRAFLIGRRFRLVHVHVGAETIEVSTFRAAQTGDDATDEHGRLLSDNVYGTPGRGRRAPRLHRQRALLRPGDRGGLGLRRRRGRHPRAAPEADRTADDALPRGPGAHAARGAPRRQARRRDRAEDGGADPEARVADAERAAGAPVRRDAEAAAVRATRSRRSRACARTGCRTACCRCST